MTDRIGNLLLLIIIIPIFILCWPVAMCFCFESHCKEESASAGWLFTSILMQTAWVWLLLYIETHYGFMTI